MSESKQPHLNGAYYGPSIPPPSTKYHRPGRGSGCGCLCNCLFSLIFKIICTIVVTIGIIILVLWLVFRPNKVKFYATEANLTQFDLSTTNNTLYYNLALNLRIRNPNKRVGVYYDRIEASGYYEDHRLQTNEVERFYQGHKNTADVKTTFQGENIVVLQNRMDYELEKREGIYSIDVKLRLRIRLKAWWFKTPRFTTKVECDLRVPMNNNNNGGNSNSFQSTRCDIDW
ncbi:NDR1/HIN1-like protein 3 [Impatiens glandulifera]|uniref:NDR1/HIN1-like protein 3 n=1 Tax=Impatiens glandulifera TaxID=253017 RepID=UPI001FB19BA8|nr:NDR1/HIN1-like protein 3 [Impatiens glandulifera]